MTTDDKELTEAQLNQRRAAPLRHGQRGAFASSGDEAVLTPPQRGRLAELRADLAVPDGAINALRERAARALLLVEWGEAWLQAKAEKEGAISAFESPMLARFFTAISESRRLLESLIKLQAKGDGGINADDVLQAVRRGK